MRTTVARGLLAFLLGFTLVLGVMGSRGHGATTLLPNGTQCFQQASGPLASGSINMFVPSTTTPKNTWKDSGQATLNTNPIQLDANGCAVIYGTGSYRQQVFTGPVVGGVTTGTLLYDVLTADTSSFNSVFWAGTAGGTANAITVVDAGFNSTDGSVINFLALNTNTGSTTLNVSGGGAVLIKVPSSSGPVAINSGCIVANNPISVVYSSSASAFILLTPCQVGGTVVSQTLPQPQGYLTLSSDPIQVAITTDQVGATSVFYTPYLGNQIPIWNGTGYTLFTFTQLTLSLSANNLANTIYDVCIFNNSGTVTIVTGPAWTNSGGGTSSRGTGAGTAQLQRVQGLLVNANAINAANGASSFTVPANQCTYVGSILMDSTNGQVSNYVSWGSIRKWGVWNFYNRLIILLQQGFTNAGPTYSFGGNNWRVSNAFTTNTLSAFEGTAEDPIHCFFKQSITMSGTGAATIGIGVNWLSLAAPTQGTFGQVSGTAGAQGSTVWASAVITPSIGLNSVVSTEITSNTATFGSGSQNMVLQCTWRG